jgi:hypothetical protein
MLCLAFMHCRQVGKVAIGGEIVSTFGHLWHPEGYSELEFAFTFQDKYAFV